MTVSFRRSGVSSRIAGKHPSILLQQADEITAKLPDGGALLEAQRAATFINMGGRTEQREVVGGEQIAMLARDPGLARA